MVSWHIGGRLGERSEKGTPERTIARDVLLWANGEGAAHALQA